MRLEKGIISSSQLMFLIAGFYQGSILANAFASRITKRDTWLALLIGLVITSIFALVNITLSKKFPNENLVQIHAILYGTYLGNFISAAYLFFIFMAMVYNLRFIGDFFLTYLIPETPLPIVVTLFTFICAWSVRKGIEVLARMSFTLVLITFVEIAFTLVLLIKDMELSNFLPVLDIPLRDFIQGVHIITTIPLAAMIVFQMIFPSLSSNQKIKSSVLLGLLLGAVTLILTDFRNNAVLGITLSIMYSPSFETVRLIDLGEIFTRLEVLVGIVMMNTMFLKVAVLYYGTALGTAQLLRLKSYSPLVLPIGILGISFALFTIDSSVEHSSFAVNTYPFFAIPFEFLLPLLSFVLAIVRGFPQQKKEAGK